MGVPMQNAPMAGAYAQQQFAPVPAPQAGAHGGYVPQAGVQAGYAPQGQGYAPQAVYAPQAGYPNQGQGYGTQGGGYGPVPIAGEEAPPAYAAAI